MLNIYLRTIKMEIESNMKPQPSSWYGPNCKLLSGIKTLSVLLLVSICSGCLSMKSYVDPKYRDATYSEITVPDQPHPVVLTVHFLVNDKPKRQVDRTLQVAVHKVLSKSRVFTERGDSTMPKPGHLDITVNDVGDLGAAGAKGVGTGLTLGLAGSEVVDGYVMTVTYNSPEGNSITKSYNHAIHSTIGMHGAPKGMEPMAPAEAFNKVVEDMLLNFFKDMHAAGL
jgi:hypothetical protein